MTTPRNVDDLSYEEARDELVSIVAQLEAGSVSLDDSLALWERGESLAVRCQTLLEGARERVEKARTKGEPVPSAEGTA